MFIMYLSTYFPISVQICSYLSTFVIQILLSKSAHCAGKKKRKRPRKQNKKPQKKKKKAKKKERIKKGRKKGQQNQKEKGSPPPKKKKKRKKTGPNKKCQKRMRNKRQNIIWTSNPFSRSFQIRIHLSLFKLSKRNVTVCVVPNVTAIAYTLVPMNISAYLIFVISFTPAGFLNPTILHPKITKNTQKITTNCTKKCKICIFCV